MSTRALAAVAALLLCAAGAFWITSGVRPYEEMKFNPWHHYEYLTEGFAHGHTYLSVQPDPAMLALKDPRDPAANVSYRLWDASLYQGRYYLYFGPTPAVVLMLPWRLLTGAEMSQRVAVALFAALAMAFLVRLVWEVRREHFPGVGAGALFAIVVVAFHASWFPVTLRRPGVWELPIICAVGCLWAALYFLWRFRRSDGGAAWGAAAGAALALLLGARVTGLLAAALIVGLLLVPVGGAGPRRLAWRGALLAIAVVSAGGLALLAYNHARFGRWTEFGQQYQLWGADERTIRHFNPAFIPTNAHFYLTSFPALTPYFPFVRGYWPPDLPAGYINTEEMQGILYVIPVQLVGLVALAWISRPRPGRALGPLRVLLLAAGGSSVLVGAVLFCFAGACSRYMTELLGGWTVLTAIGLLMVAAHRPATRSRRLLQALAWVAAAWSVAAVWLASAGFRGYMKVTSPRAYAAVGHLLDYPSWWWAQDHGVRYGPVDLDVRIPGPFTEESPLVINGEPQRVNQLRIAPVDATHVRLLLLGKMALSPGPAVRDAPLSGPFRILETPPLPVASGRLQVRLTAAWLFPPSEHPYWDQVAPAERERLQTYFEIATPGFRAAIHSPRSYDPASLAPLVLTADRVPAGAPFVAALRPVPP